MTDFKKIAVAALKLVAAGRLPKGIQAAGEFPAPDSSKHDIYSL
ncbi:MAG: hypothetical protein ACTSU5_04920 [Promethearchaeota archaeon]